MASEGSELNVISIPSSEDNGENRDLGKNLVLLHGWGSNAQDLAALQEYFAPQGWNLYCLNGIFPHPHAPGGWMWYDLERSDWPGLLESRRLVLQWVSGLEARSGVPLSRTVLGGFSQGAAMSLDVGLSLPLGGLMILSGYLHPSLDLVTIATPAPQILVVHGRQDTIVPIQAAHQIHHFLKNVPTDIAVTYEEMDAGHEVSREGLAAMERFLAGLL
jgi:phospholipase/carboxylesterase